VFEVLRAASGFFGHANASIPARWERWVSLVFITPDIHRVHHGIDTRDHDTNYGVFFSFWDRLAGTLRRRSGPVATGIADVSAGDSARPVHLLLMPFQRK
jgi:sterol desaturase/sphingolipid hydroxylase (fatty acid hydroxylase superfamily)